MTKADRVREVGRVAKIGGARRKGNLDTYKLSNSLPLSADVDPGQDLVC